MISPFYLAFFSVLATLCSGKANDILQKTISLESSNYPSYFWNVRSDKTVYIDKVFASSNIDSHLLVVSGLIGKGVSFRTTDGRYLRHRGYLLYADKTDGSTLFKNDASFYVENGISDKDGYSFRSVNFPRHFIRHYGYRLRISEPGRKPFNEDATFHYRNPDFAKAIIHRSIRFESHNYKGHFIHARFDRSVYIDNSPAHFPVFKIVPGLKGEGVSFRADDGSYLRHSGYLLWAHINDGSDLFKKDATFIPLVGIADKSKYSFRSYNYPRHYIRHQGYRVKISDEVNSYFNADVTWDLVDT